MKYTLLIALFTFQVMAIDLSQMADTTTNKIEVLDINKKANWPEGKITWRFYNKWPSDKAKTIRTIMKAHPEFEESECGTVNLVWMSEKKTIWGLIPGNYGLITYIDTDIEIISCSAVFNATQLKKLKKQPFADVAKTFIPLILHRITPPSRKE